LIFHFSKSFARRDHLRSIELRIQKIWEENEVFKVEKQVDSDGIPVPKFMVTFPYPYMNGRLHLVGILSFSFTCESNIFRY